MSFFPVKQHERRVESYSNRLPDGASLLHHSLAGKMLIYWHAYLDMPKFANQPGRSCAEKAPDSLLFAQRLYCLFVLRRPANQLLSFHKHRQPTGAVCQEFSEDNRD